MLDEGGTNPQKVESWGPAPHVSATIKITFQVVQETSCPYEKKTGKAALLKTILANTPNAFNQSTLVIQPMPNRAMPKPPLAMQKNEKKQKVRKPKSEKGKSRTAPPGKDDP